MGNDLTGEHKQTIIIVGMLLIALCFGMAELRGCSQDANAHIKALAEQGINAEVAPSGNLRVIDTRNFRASKAEEGK